MNPDPQNFDLDTERQVLGQILDFPEAFSRYDAAGLSSADFYRQAHAQVWDAASNAASDGLEPNQPTVARYLRTAGTWETVGPAYFGALTDGVPRPNEDTIAACVRHLKDLAAARKAWAASERFAAACRVARGGLDADTLAAHVAELDAIRDGGDTGTRGDLDGQLSALGDYLTRPETRRVKFGIAGLDDVLGGIDVGDVCGILARTSVGKTLLACHVARMAASASIGQVLFSLEMPTAAVVARLARAEFGWSRYRLQTAWTTGEFNQDTYRRAYAGLYVVDTSGLTLDRIEQIVRSQQRRQTVELVTIDYLGLIAAHANLSTYDRTSQIAVGLKGLAKRCHVAVLVLIQANRAGGQDGSERLTLTSARDAGVVEEALDVLIGMRRVDHSPKVSDEARQRYQDVIWAEVMKNRHGSVSTRETAIRVNPTSLALTEDPTLTMDEHTAKRVSARAAGTGGY